MGLPVNINELITGKTIEWERLEFKAGWNPESIIKTICAFANDINNWGGGYVIVGIAEDNGQPILPPAGLRQEKLDGIQKELMGLCHQLRPQYFPVVEPVEFQGKWILIIWVPGGEARPYKAPDSLGENRTYSYYVRHFSTTRKATEAEERELLQMSAHIPFDDRVQQHASVTDLKLPLIQSHLAIIGSALFEQSKTMPFDELCRKMNIVNGPDEYLLPKNIGLLLFNDDPKQFFPSAQIDLVQFKDEIGDDFTEKVFNGPVQQQLQDGLLYLKNNIIAERVTKVTGRAEATRVFNYPFDAIEEALANTVYHRSYEDDSPIEIRIFPSRIEIISYPGPLPPLNKELLASGRIVARKYRNRRIGDFLKELHLTEGKGTGIPKIKRAMEANGSPEPIFETDDALGYFLTTLPVHSAWPVQDVTQDVVQDVVQVDIAILKYCLRPKKRAEIMHKIGVFNNYRNFERDVKSLIDKGYLIPTIPDKPSSGNQQYKTTPEGERYLEAQE
jgi:ATP-dependent DNA helicase RecG